jgi:hypothetical protein
MQKVQEKVSTTSSLELLSTPNKLISPDSDSTLHIKVQALVRLSKTSPASPAPKSWPALAMLRWEVQRIRGDSFGTEVGVSPSPECSKSILLESSSPYRRSWTFAVSLGHQGHQQVIQSRQLFKTTSNEH